LPPVCLAKGGGEAMRLAGPWAGPAGAPADGFYWLPEQQWKPFVLEPCRGEHHAW